MTCNKTRIPYHVRIYDGPWNSNKIAFPIKVSILQTGELRSILLVENCRFWKNEWKYNILIVIATVLLVYFLEHFKVQDIVLDSLLFADD